MFQGNSLPAKKVVLCKNLEICDAWVLPCQRPPARCSGVSRDTSCNVGGNHNKVECIQTCTSTLLYLPGLCLYMYLGFGPHPAALSIYSLALHSENTPSRPVGPYGMPRIRPEEATCKARALLAVLTAAPCRSLLPDQTTTILVILLMG